MGTSSQPLTTEQDRGLSPAEKLRVAFDLFTAGTRLMRQNLIRKHPEATAEEIDVLFRKWMRHRPGAEYGDGEGRPVSWPRTR